MEKTYIYELTITDNEIVDDVLDDLECKNKAFGSQSNEWGREGNTMKYTYKGSMPLLYFIYLKISMFFSNIKTYGICKCKFYIQ